MENQLKVVNIHGYQNKLSSSLYQLQQQNYMCDCIIETKQINVSAHKVVLLASGCPYFQMQVSRDMSTQNQCFVIDLRDQEYQDVITIVQLIYTGEMCVNNSNAERIVKLCNFLNLKEAADLCASVIRNMCVCKSGTELQSQELEFNHVNSLSKINLEFQREVPDQCNNARTESIASKVDEMSELDIEDNVLTTGINSHFLESQSEDSYKDRQKHDKYGTDINVTGVTENVDSIQHRKNVTMDKVNPKATNSGSEKHCVVNPSHKKTSEIKAGKKLEEAISKSQKTKVKRTHLNEGKFNNCSETHQKKHDKDVFPPPEKKQKMKYKMGIRCRICKTDFADEKRLKEHRNAVHLLVCSVCSWTSNRGSNMAGHMFVQHGIMYNKEKYPLIHCSYPGCDFKSTKNFTINVHKLRHSDEKKFKCSMCGSAFKLKTAYNAHLKTHEPDQLRYECEICGQKFIRPSILKEHKKKHAQNTELCHLCPWSSRSSRELHIHLLKVHSVPLPKNFKVLKCNNCDYYTFTNIQMRSHMDLHSGDKKYQCQVCGRLSKSELRLRGHLRTHKDLNTEFQCPHEGCSYKSKRKPCLQDHISSKHSLPEYKPFQCHLCDYCCKLKGNLDKHLRSIHKLEVMTVNKLWGKVLETGEGYGSIVNRLKGFKTKGAIRMSIEEEEVEECNQIIEQS